LVLLLQQLLSSSISSRNRHDGDFSCCEREAEKYHADDAAGSFRRPRRPGRHQDRRGAGDFVEEVRKIAGKHGVDVVLDMVGGTYLPRNLSLMAAEGRLVQIGFLQSATVENFDLRPIMLRRLTLTGSTLRARSVQQKAEVATALREKIWPLLDNGLVKPLIHATFPLEQARHAHEMMESSSHLDKIVLVTGK
jgi:NADPH:quinone reductase-like Zn-dependent oxidoreductase